MANWEIKVGVIWEERVIEGWVLNEIASKRGIEGAETENTSLGKFLHLEG